jgi:hypothetical protein
MGYPNGAINGVGKTHNGDIKCMNGRVCHAKELNNNSSKMTYWSI